MQRQIFIENQSTTENIIQIITNLYILTSFLEIIYSTIILSANYFNRFLNNALALNSSR